MVCAHCEWVYGAYVAVGSMKGAKISKTRILGHGTTNMELQPEHDQNSFSGCIKCFKSRSNGCVWWGNLFCGTVSRKEAVIGSRLLFRACGSTYICSRRLKSVSIWR